MSAYQMHFNVNLFTPVKTWPIRVKPFLLFSKSAENDKTCGPCSRAQQNGILSELIGL